MNKYNKIFLALAITAVSAFATLDQTAWAQETAATPDRVAMQGSFPAGSGRGEGRPSRDGAAGVIDREVTHAAVATALNMTVEALDAAKEAGQTLAEIAEAQGVTLESVNAAAKASMTAQVNQALTAGEITQEQANAMLERIENGRSGHHRGEGATDQGTDSASTIEQANALQREAAATGSITNVVLDNTVLFLPTIVGYSN